MNACRTLLLAALTLSVSALAQTTPDTMPVNTWLAVPNTHMRSVAPTNGQFAGTWGTSGPTAVIVAWGGAALDTKRSRLVLWGGGHADYYGNELYAFDVPTLSWQRLTNPTVNPVMDQEVNADGTPNSRHTYGGLAYIAHADRFFGQAGALAGIGFANCSRTWTFDFVAKQWANRNPATTPGGGIGGNCSYDPATRKVWWCSASGSFAGLWSYDYDTNAWAKHNSDNFYYYSSAIDTKRGVMVVVGNGEIFSYAIGSGNYTKSAWTTTGGNALLANSNPGFDYDPITDRFVGWCGGAVYALDPVTKVWTSYNPPGAPIVTGLYPTEGPGYQTGIYGRWRYVPSVNAFALVTSIDDDVHFYKFSAGGGNQPPGDITPPTCGLSAPATNATLTGQVTVSATASDANGVVGVQFNLDGVALGVEDLSSPYSVSWDTTKANNGSHTLIAVARDAAGNTTTSTPATVTVNNAGSGITSFQLTAGTTGTLPFTVGLGFKKGDISGVPVLSVPATQVIVKRRWNDGSVKHAIASGQAPMTSGSPITVNVTAGTASAGTDLTAFDIQTANPSASVVLGSIGTVNLSGLLASPFRTWVSGPEMVEAHYRSAVGSDPTLVTWFYVRLYKGGRMFIRAVVENGLLDVSTANKSYVPTVTIGGTVVYNNGGAALTHYAHTRWTQEGWIGGDPQITPKLNTNYLIDTKLVPNYWKRNPSASVLNGLYQTYVPNQRGDWTANMGETGYQSQIGLLPLWDALYLTSGGDARSFKSVLANAKALNSYAILWSDSATKLPVMPSNRPDWSLFGAGQGGGNPPSAGSLQWEGAHHGSGGYLAYLITGDYYYLETMEHQAATCYLAAGSGYGRGLGTNRAFLTQTRGEAWAERTVGQLAGIGPTGDAIVNDYKALLSNLGARWLSVAQTPGVSPLGYVYAYEIGGGAYSSTAGVIAPWQQHFWIQSVGAISDLEPFADMTAWNGFRNHMYKAVVGILGTTGPENYFYGNASNYTIQIADTPTGDPAMWYASWGTVFQKTFGVPNTTGGNTMLGGSGGAPGLATGYWGNLLPAIAHAVDHGAPGAAASWARLSTSNNWSTFENSGFGDAPIWGIVPRAVTPVVPNAPPTIQSFSYLPAAPKVGDLITFTVVASDPDGNALTIQFDYGDSVSNSLGTHAYNAAGIYTVTVTIKDGVNPGISSSATVVVTSASDDNGGGAGVPVDSDGDGVSDTNEIGDGTNPLDPLSLLKIPMTVNALRITLKFNADGRDAISIAGALPDVPKLLEFSGQPFVVMIDGMSARFTLDAKGRAHEESGTVAFKLKSIRNKQTKKREFAGGAVPFKVRLKRGTWWDELGMDPKAGANKIAKQFEANIAFNGRVYSAIADGVYSAKADKAGSFKFP